MEWEWLGGDHITYAVRDIESWKAVYIDCFGFREIHHTRDASPEGTSSMELYGLESGHSRIALVSPINREEISHVQYFISKHGDHSIQHVAYGIRNLEAFITEMKAKGFNFLGDIKYRSDAFGQVKQIFAKRFDANLTPADGAFYEFVERPVQTEADGADFFSHTTAKDLYEDVERDVVNDDGKPFKAFMSWIYS